MLFLAVLAAIGAHVVARHGALIDHVHFPAAFWTIGQRRRPRRFTAVEAFNPRRQPHRNSFEEIMDAALFPIAARSESSATPAAASAAIRAASRPASLAPRRRRWRRPRRPE